MNWGLVSYKIETNSMEASRNSYSADWAGTKQSLHCTEHRASQGRRFLPPIPSSAHGTMFVLQAKVPRRIIMTDIPDDPGQLLLPGKIFPSLHQFPEIITEHPAVQLMAGIA